MWLTSLSVASLGTPNEGYRRRRGTRWPPRGPRRAAGARACPGACSAAPPTGLVTGTEERVEQLQRRVVGERWTAAARQESGRFVCRGLQPGHRRGDKGARSLGLIDEHLIGRIRVLDHGRVLRAQVAEALRPLGRVPEGRLRVGELLRFKGLGGEGRVWSALLRLDGFG